MLASDGRIALSELARVAGELQAEVERVTNALQGADDVRTGRRPTGIVEATRLDLVGFYEGSAVLVVEPHEQQMSMQQTLLEESLTALLDGIEALTDDPHTLPRGFDRAVLHGLRDMTGSIGRTISTIRFELPSRPPVIVADEVKEAVRDCLRSRPAAEDAVTGRLHMGDFAPSTLRCRIDTPQASVTCSFDDELRDEVLGLMDQLVTVRGRAERLPGSDDIRVLHVDTVEPVTEAASRSVAELVAEQGIAPITDAHELVGEPIDDFEEFIAAIRSLRTA